ncbi:hypothetical protein DFQ28_004734 [Apophysomyces sp. BC1034]|nr:hypothetical protein DFQ28_004734 [Apophysomyces sp. BC1034]
MSYGYQTRYSPTEIECQTELVSRPTDAPDFPLTPPMDTRQLQFSSSSPMESSHNRYHLCSQATPQPHANQAHYLLHARSTPSSLVSTMTAGHVQYAPAPILMDSNQMQTQPMSLTQVYHEGATPDLAISSSTLSSSSSGSIYPAQGSISIDSNQGLVYVRKACVGCKASHVACDAQRPCIRCIRLNKACECVDAERKKRGRPCGSGKKNKINNPSPVNLST